MKEEDEAIGFMSKRMIRPEKGRRKAVKGFVDITEVSEGRVRKRVSSEYFHSNGNVSKHRKKQVINFFLE